MEVNVLQGLNLESEITTIKISLDGKEVPTELLDRIKSFGEVFLYEYLLKDQNLTVRSRLPHLWKEIAKGLNRFSTNEWDLSTLESYILEEVINSQVKSMSTIPILEAAMKKGYEITQTMISEGIDYYSPHNGSSWNRRYAIGAGQEVEHVASVSSTKDSYLAQKLQRDKWSTNTLVSRLSLPIAKWEIIESKEHLERVFPNYPTPVVIKPGGLTGGSGVTTNIMTIEHALKAYDYALGKINAKIRSEWQQKVMIQQQVSGDDYRILVIDGKMRIATKRIPAFVVGDGKKSIRQLIEETNKDPRRDTKNPRHTLKPIGFDTLLEEFLSEQDLTLESVPKADEKVFVRKVASMSQGGITEDFTNKVHPQIKYIVESLAATIKAFVLGVDIICKNISKPLTLENGSLIEMNTMPEAYLNSFPVIGKQYPEIGEMIIEGLMKDKKITQKIVFIGEYDKPFAEILLNMGVDLEVETTGGYSSGSMFIEGEEIQNGLEVWKAVESLKLNGLLSTVILHYRNLKEVEQVGLGFERINLLVTQEPHKMFDRFLEQGLIGKIILT